MINHYDHLPEGIIAIWTQDEPPIKILSVRRCPKFNRPCNKKTENCPCCAGAIKDCPQKCCNNDEA